MLELLAIAIIAGVLGALIGYAAQEGIAVLLRDLVRGQLPRPALSPGWLGLMTSILILIGFALPPLLQLRKVPPARVLRRNLEPPPLRYAVVYGTAVAALAALLYWLVRDPKLLGYVSAATLGTFVVLIAAGWLLVRSLSTLRGSVGVSWRYGMANIARRGRDSVIQIVAFGLGLMVLLLLAVVRNDLMQQWRASLPENAPNHFMINIRPDQTAAIREFFAEQSAVSPPELVPMVRARLTEINGTPVAELKMTNERGRDFLEREANLTWAQSMQKDNKLVAGEWWQADDGGGPRVSVEIELAQSLGSEDRRQADLQRRRRDRRRHGGELPRGAVGLVPAELLHGVLARHARRHHRHVHHERPHPARAAQHPAGVHAAVSGGHRDRPGSDPDSGARRDGQGVVGRAVRLRFHVAGRNHGAACRDPGDAR